MSDFKAKMHQIRLGLELRRRPRCRCAVTVLPDPLGGDLLPRDSNPLSSRIFVSQPWHVG